MKILNTHFFNLIKLALLCLPLLLIPTQSQAEGREVSFTWSGQNTTTVTGYRLYYKKGLVSESDPNYDGTDLSIKNSSTVSRSPINLDSSATGITLERLSANETYSFALTAWNSAGESDYATVSPVTPLPFIPPTITTMSRK